MATPQIHPAPLANDHRPSARRARIKSFYGGSSSRKQQQQQQQQPPPVTARYPESIRPRSVALTLTEAMGLLKSLRPKARPKPGSRPNDDYYVSPPQQPLLYSEQRDYTSSPAYAPGGRDYTARLPADVLQRICGFVCPATLDDSYIASEQSSATNGCGLCDLRDLARTAQLSRKWYKAAQSMLYSSVRIDAVHYCELEIILSEKRHRKSTFRHPSHTTASNDVPARRLELFCRTVRESPSLAKQVEILKLPYMTRETSKGEMAATVAVLPNLRYVDLPDGAFSGDPACHTLLHELEARCPDIRKMSFYHGSETRLEGLAKGHWQMLEQVEINGVITEPGVMRFVLAALPALQHLMLSDMPWLNDQIFNAAPNIPAFPALQSLAIQNCPQITAAGLKTYFDSSANRESLDTLHLKSTGITVPTIADFLFAATHLTELTFIAKVSFTDSLTLTTAGPLSSISLQNLIYEITDTDDAGVNLSKPSASFYAYLIRSLHSNQLPALQSVYVHDPTFVDALLRPPLPTGAAPSTLASPLDIFAKGRDDDEYTYTFVTPTGTAARTSTNPFADPRAQRPLSAFNPTATAGPQWHNADGYLSAPPPDAPRPRSAASGDGAPSAAASHRASVFSPQLTGAGGAWPHAAPSAGKGYADPYDEGGAAGDVRGLSGLVARVGLGGGINRRGRKKIDLWR